MSYKPGDLIMVPDRSGAVQFAEITVNYNDIPGTTNGYLVKLLSNGRAMYIRENEVVEKGE